MGGKHSRHKSHKHHSTSYTHIPLNSRSSQSHSCRDHDEKRQLNLKARLKAKYSRIGDNYHSLPQVTEALAQAGLESSNLIVGIDFTKSNDWEGERSFNGMSLHHLGGLQNPYEQAISIIGSTLSAFDEDNLIPCYGFGDASTHDKDVFSFYPDDRPCNGFEEVLSRYREIVPQLNLSGPTSFAPIIESGIRIVESSGGQYHVLLIIADGQVTRCVSRWSSKLSPQEHDTMNAIVKASDYPLSIVVVGVGDGPWDMMHKFDNNIPYRAFDNFQFVNFTEIMSKNIPISRKETEFALAALMEIPSQYKATIDLQLLGCRRGTSHKLSLPPPVQNIAKYTSPSPSSNQLQKITYPSAPSAEISSQCPLCHWYKKDLAFGCGHQTCYHCGVDMNFCPSCLTPITTRVRLYD